MFGIYIVINIGKAMFKGKFIAIKSMVEIKKLNNLTSQLKKLEKEGQSKLKESRSMGIIKIRVETNVIENF